MYKLSRRKKYEIRRSIKNKKYMCMDGILKNNKWVSFRIINNNECRTRRIIRGNTYDGGLERIHNKKILNRNKRST